MQRNSYILKVIYIDKHMPSGMKAILNQGN